VIADSSVLRASQWCYRGIWSVLTGWLLVPSAPPALAGADDTTVRQFRPAEGYLRYLKFYFWICLVVIDVGLAVFWLIIFVMSPLIGILISPLALAVIVLPDVVAYVAIHLRYDTTWYVLSDRTMRIRRGIWQIHETTITYENIQNVAVRQGPVQRYFGIANVIVKTAGGGGGGHGSGHSDAGSGHHGLLEGVDNAEAIRGLIVEAWQRARSAGLGDDADKRVPRSAASWSPAELDLLRQIRDQALRLVNAG
jgi:membrane protein YdbS with pleckstrin-like domain